MTRPGTVKKWLEEHVDHVGSDCLEFPFSRDTHGYGCINFGGFRAAHRWMCNRAHADTKMNGPMALHTCGNGHLGCVNPKHLYWGTLLDNYLDAVNHGTVHPPRSELREYPVKEAAFARAKLTKAEVSQIRAEYVPGVTGFRQLSNKFRVHRTTIKSILNFETWKDVQTSS